MNLRKLLQGPSRVTTEMGTRQELIRLAPLRAEPEFRKVSISYAPMTVRRSFLFPWQADEVLESWDITAKISLRDGQTFRVSKLVRLDFEKAMELMMLEVVKAATLEKMQQLQARRVG